MMLLDTSAVLGYLQGEPSCEIVASEILTGQASICVVNQTEVLSKLCDKGMGWPDAQKALGKLALLAEPFTSDTAREAARLRPLRRGPENHLIPPGGPLRLASLRHAP